MAQTMTKKKTLKSKVDRGETIDLRDKQTVYATAAAPHHILGEEIKLHPKQAARFIEKGFATETKPAPQAEEE